VAWDIAYAPKRSVRVPIRARITAAFAAVMLLLLIAIGLLAYLSMGAALLDEIDSDLRFRASAVEQTAQPDGSETPDPRLQEPREAFQQFVRADGTVLHATQGFDAPLLSRRDLAGMTGPRFFQRQVPGVVGDARLLAIPTGARAGARFLVVGASMADRIDALRQLVIVLAIGGPVAVAVACLAAWIVAGWALHPMERMRQQAAAITASGTERRMPVPRTRDELQRLALTLNGMLDRLASSMASERAFLERASHELRTPLAALRAEVDLALRRQRTAAELSAALASVSQETDRLSRLAEDLLVLARAGDGRLPLHREAVSLRATLDSVSTRFEARALELDVVLCAAAPDTTISVDSLRLRQALVNLLDNALRHTPRNGRVDLVGTIIGRDVRITVTDTGSGFGSAADEGTAGLGLRIVRAVARSHGGTVEIGRADEGGARVELVLPHAAGADSAGDTGCTEVTAGPAASSTSETGVQSS
jgi:two-component system OmpR family sensor kinase